MPTFAETTHPLHDGVGATLYAVRRRRVPLQVLSPQRPSLHARVGAVLTDTAYLLALVATVPVAVMLVGTPLALTIVLILWIGRQALGLL